VTGDRLIRRLDAAAEWTGVPALAHRQPRRRAMRWLPILPLLLACAGVVLCIAGYNGLWSGYSMVMVGFIVSVWIPMFGPLKPWGTCNESVDERERDLRRRAFFVTVSIIALTATMALLLLPVLVAAGQWAPDLLVRRVNALGFTLFTVFNALPTLYASWAMRPLPVDAEE